ncbi:hypothetical protein B296_00049422 [Ensete ventricosum]|uniref:Uncharacterized protein n=1 Tax=Ensete ventricosum TaxID=4639 RepID=A0A426XCY0_ENSVE|nr:hypothetical protein B296_00049422 [Ensete ventricosum]
MPLSGPSAVRPVEFDGDDFEEYNPHPYLGGYDIALTYGGHPLPHSSATCYPISSSASLPSEQTTPPPPHATAPTFDHAGGGWNGWGRALDYLFGHAQGYGERRVGVDSYGIPIYANKKLGGAESVVVEVEPAPVQRLAYYHPHSRASCCGEATEETHGYENPVLAYNEHHNNQQAIESAWHQKLSRHEAYQDQVHHTSVSSALSTLNLLASRQLMDLV